MQSPPTDTPTPTPDSRTLHAQLEAARLDHTALVGDLPALEQLVQDNTARVEAIRQKPKTAELLAELSSAQGRVAAAETLLADHRGEIEAAHTRVLSLEAEHLRLSQEERLAQLEREYTDSHSDLETLRLKVTADLEQGLSALAQLQRKRHLKLMEAQGVLHALEHYGEHLASYTGLHSEQQWQRGKLDGEIIAARGDFARALLQPQTQDTQHCFRASPWYALNALHEEK